MGRSTHKKHAQELLRDRAFSYLRAKQYNEAQKEFLELKLPKICDYVGMARCYAGLNDIPEALKLLNSCANKATTPSDTILILVTLSMLYLLSNKLNLAKEMLSKVDSAHAHDSRVLYSWTKYYIFKKDLDSAIDICKLNEKCHPTRHLSYLDHAVLLRCQDNALGAINFLNAAGFYEPYETVRNRFKWFQRIHYAKVLNMYAIFYQDLSAPNFTLAIQFAKRAVQAHPGYASALSTLAKLITPEVANNIANSYFSKARQVDPQRFERSHGQKQDNYDHVEFDEDDYDLEFDCKVTSIESLLQNNSFKKEVRVAQGVRDGWYEEGEKVVPPIRQKRTAPLAAPESWEDRCPKSNQPTSTTFVVTSQNGFTGLPLEEDEEDKADEESIASSSTIPSLVVTAIDSEVNDLKIESKIERVSPVAASATLLPLPVASPTLKLNDENRPDEVRQPQPVMDVPLMAPVIDILPAAVLSPSAPLSSPVVSPELKDENRPVKDVQINGMAHENEPDSAVLDPESSQPMSLAPEVSSINCYQRVMRSVFFAGKFVQNWGNQSRFSKQPPVEVNADQNQSRIRKTI
jgi:tetratricopeptide (TPR) repeat protein